MEHPQFADWETYIDDDPDRLRHWLAALAIELSAARQSLDVRNSTVMDQIDVVLREIDLLDRRIRANRMN